MDEGCRQGTADNIKICNRNAEDYFKIIANSFRSMQKR